jgi:hypothetical protein
MRLLVCAALLVLPQAVCAADLFDRYTNPMLAKVVAGDGVKEIKQLTPAIIADHDRVLPGSNTAFLIVRTNDNRLAKLLVQPARQKIDQQKSVPILLIDRFVTFREGDERTVQASSKNVYLFGGFRFNLDIGQVVPDAMSADVRFVAEGGKSRLEPVGKAKLYLVTKLAALNSEKVAKLVIGETFEARYFNGTFKLYDDGRRSGSLTLKVEEGNAISGAYYSDKDGRKYEVYGRVLTPLHAVQFTVKFPRAEQSFQGWMFTGDGKAIAGSSKLQERETGFYAVRSEDN